MLPKTGQGKGLSILAIYEEGLFRSRLSPFVKAIGRNETAAFFEGVPIGGFRGDGFSARIDRAVTVLRLFGPMRDQSSTDLYKRSLAVHAANGDRLRGGDVVAWAGIHHRDSIQHPSIIKGFAALGKAAAHNRKHISPLFTAKEFMFL